MTRHHGFTCPNCGSHAFGTFKYHPAMGKQYPADTRVGSCHEHYSTSESTCRFTWNRDDYLAESQCMYEQSEAEWQDAYEEMRVITQAARDKSAMHPVENALSLEAAQ